MLELRLRGSRREYRKQPGMWAEHKHSAQCGDVAMSPSRDTYIGSLRTLEAFYADEEDEEDEDEEDEEEANQGKYSAQALGAEKRCNSARGAYSSAAA
jgi:hypothetical protein